MARPVLGLLPLLLAFAAPLHAEGIHKWVDAEGHVHFGDEASAEKGSTTVTPKGGNFVRTERPVTADDAGPAPAPPANPAATAKSQHMMGRYNMARGERPKEGPQAFGVHPPQTYTSQAAHLTDYMHGMRPSNQQPLQQRYLGAAQGIVAQFGTVFGIRSGGSWKFYRQTRTRVYRYGPPNGMGGFADTASWEDPVCVRFWP